MVVDASIAVKWSIDEIDRDAALKLLSDDGRIVAPDLLLSEVANVLRKKVKGGQLTAVQAAEAASLVVDTVDEFLPASEVVHLALSLADELDHSAYDCIYLACALHFGRVLVTADVKFRAKCAETDHAAIVVTADEWWARPLAIDPARLADIARLSDKISVTAGFLKESASEPIAQTGLRIVRSTQSRPLFESPAYGHLRSQLLSMSRVEVAELVALAWIGRGYGDTAWASNFENAAHLVSSGVERHVPYIVSLMRYVPIGLQRLNEPPISPPASE